MVSLFAATNRRESPRQACRHSRRHRSWWCLRRLSAWATARAKSSATRARTRCSSTRLCHASKNLFLPSRDALRCRASDKNACFWRRSPQRCSIARPRRAYEVCARNVRNQYSLRRRVASRSSRRNSRCRHQFPQTTARRVRSRRRFWRCVVMAAAVRRHATYVAKPSAKHFFANFLCRSASSSSAVQQRAARSTARRNPTKQRNACFLARNSSAACSAMRACFSSATYARSSEKIRFRREAAVCCEIASHLARNCFSCTTASAHAATTALQSPASRRV
mmetsp:Transcript_8396/g.20194  ORF Transcript_8396/g.20194 Transcript_8396/m.20194 type:complete len:279 (+) Transcript_8396:81-917(+)